MYKERQKKQAGSMSSEVEIRYAMQCGEKTNGMLVLQSVEERERRVFRSMTGISDHVGGKRGRMAGCDAKG